MKRIFKRTLAMFLAVIMVFGAAPLSGLVGLELPEFKNPFAAKAEAATSGTCGDNLTWTYDETTGELFISGTGDMPNYSYDSTPPWNLVDINAVEIGNGVTSIGNYAFYYCASLTSVTIPNSVTSIGDYAFRACKSLTSITIPDGVTSIGNDAFSYCSSLTSVTFGSGLVDMGEDVFMSCSLLASITVDSGNTCFSTDDYGVLFNKDKTKLLICPAGSGITGYDIPNSVTSVGDDAFRDCASLTSITIPNSVTSVGSAAFSNTGYYNDENNWDGNVLYIDQCLVDAKDSIDGSYTGVELTGSYTVKEGTRIIAGYAFFYCTGLAEISLPESVEYIGDMAFNYCTGLTEISLPESVEYIGDMAFALCVNLTGSLHLNGTFYVGSFSGTRFTDITLGKDANVIYDMYGVEMENINPFYLASAYCTGITVDEENPYFSSDENGVMFNKDKSKLLCYPAGNERETYRVPDGTKEIVTYAFCGIAYDTEFSAVIVGNLQSVILPDTVETVCEVAFGYSLIDFVHIPSSVTSIGEYAFMTEELAAENELEVAGYPYICSDTEDCYAKEYAEANGIEFRLCEGHGVAHEHSYTSSVTVEPGCETEGVRTYICECEDSYTESIPAAGHTEEEWEITVEPTTSSEGEKVKKCAVCKEILEKESIPMIAEYTITYYVDGQVFDTQKYAEGEAVYHTEDPTKAGYCFLGWVNENGDAVYYDVMPGKDVVLIAMFSRMVYTVTFDANGGEFADGEQIKTYEIEYGTPLTLPDDPAREGYTFVGYGELPGTMPAKDLTIYAIWEEIEQEPTCTPKTVTVVSSTCTTDGTEYIVCEECGEPMSDIITVPALGHTEGDWETEIEATVEADGKRVKKCTACGEVLETEIIPRLNVSVVSDEKTGISMEFVSDYYNGKVEIEVAESFDGTAFNLINTKTSASQTFIYDITMTLDGVTIQPEGKVTVKIPLPEGYDPAKTFVYHVDTSENKVVKMPAEYKNGFMVFETDHFSYYALVEELDVRVDIRTPSTTSISYGDSIVLHAGSSEALPDGWRIEWSASNGNFDYTVSADGTTCTISPSSSGDTTFTVTVYDANGNVNSSDKQTMTSKAGFFDKIIAFFKKLFGLTKTIPQLYNGIF